MNQKPLHLSTEFYGREKELHHLRSALEQEGSKIVLVGGYAGTGKTELVRYFLQDTVLTKENNVVLSGKFDQMNRDPFSAVATAFSQHCKDLLERPDDNDDVERVRERMRDAIGGDQALLSIIPSLRLVLENVTALDAEKTDGAVKTSGAETEVGNVATLNRLRYSFAKFVAVIDHPILILDDLQWSDEASLQLLTTMLSDPNVKNLLIIGTFRSNEVDGGHVLTKNMELLKQTGKHVKTLHLENMTFECIKQYVVDSLQQEEIHSLVKAIYNKTQGNIFFTIQFMSALHRKGILDYSYVSCRWEWDIDRLDNETMLTDNVVDVVLNRIQMLSKQLQRVLGTAALLPSTFDCRILGAVLQERNGGADVGPLLDLAVTEGFLESIECSDTYKFTHDKIQQAAMETIPDKEDLSFHVGKRLFEFYNRCRKKQPWMLFVAVDKLNAQPRSLSKMMDSLEQARMNLAVAEEAIAIAAFVPATTYLRRAVSELKCGNTIEAPWDERYELCLRAFTNATNVEFSLGNFVVGKDFAQEALDNAKTLTDKIPIYRGMESGFGSQERYNDSIATSVEVLKKLGEYPRSVAGRAILDLISLKRSFHNLTDRDILSLPLIDDNSPKAAAVEFYTQIHARAVLCNNKFLVVLSATRALSITIKHGLNRSAALAFACYAVMVLAGFNDFRTAKRVASLAKQILNSPIPQRGVPTAVYGITATVEAWTNPLPALLNQCLDGYKTGMQCGEFEFALACFAANPILSFCAGLPLATIERDFASVVEQCRLYKYRGMEGIIAALLEMCQELTGSSKAPLSWTSSVKDAVVFSSTSGKGSSETYRVTRYNFCRMIVAYYFHKLPLADKLRDQFLNTSTAHPSFTIISVGCFFSCLVSLGMAKATKGRTKRRYEISAKKERAKMKTFLKERGLNVLHRYYLMDAEFTSAFPGHTSVDEQKIKYDKAIAAATKAGFMQDAALGNELAGQFIMESCEDEFWARHYFTRGYELYLSWGAKAKASHFLKQHREHIFTDEVGRRKMSTVVRSNDSMAREAIKMHKSIDFDHLSSLSDPSETSLMSDFLSRNKNKTGR